MGSRGGTLFIVAQWSGCYKWLKEEIHIWPLTFCFESCENKDEIVVEVGELVELFKFLARQLRQTYELFAKKSLREIYRENTTQND